MTDKQQLIDQCLKVVAREFTTVQQKPTRAQIERLRKALNAKLNGEGE